MAYDQWKGNAQAADISFSACGERVDMQYVMPAGSCRLHPEVSCEGGCDLLTGPGLGPLYQQITGRDGGDAPKIANSSTVL